MTQPHLPQELVDTHDMVVVHRAFRREAQLLHDLIAAVPDGDRRRAGILADHLRWYSSGLHNHHQGEDELLWPVLRERVRMPGDVITSMEAQHERIARTLDDVMSALPAWEQAAGPVGRAELVDSLAAHRAVVMEHLDDEETRLLPLAGRYLTQHEWDALGEHFVNTTPKGTLLIFLGAVLEDADAAERGHLLGAMPAIARIVWRTVGRIAYSRRVARVRGR